MIVPSHLARGCGERTCGNAVEQHGFGEAELDRARKWTLASYEQAFNEREKAESGPLAMELVRGTEAAALAASRWVGRGDKIGADGAAVAAMRAVLATVGMNGVVVIGEGEKDEAPMLYNGEHVGDGTGPDCDVAVDPIDGTTLTAKSLPNAVSVVIIQLTLDVGYAILATSSLSFIGLGAQPPSPEWGTMMSTARNYFREAWWYTTFPGLALTLTVFAFNVLGDGLQDALDPRSGRR